MIKITRLQVRNYRGIRSIDAKVEGGVIAKGRNGSGKTSVLNALGSALAAADIGPDAVRIGELDGEILVDLAVAGAALRVRRRFGAAGSSLSITNDDGDKKAKPATFLADLLGTSPLDVLGVVIEKDKKKRRERILAALPVRVTVEQLRRWVPGLPDTFDVSGHGLEVIERLRGGAYGKRTEANKVEKAAADDLTRARLAAKAALAEVPAGAGEQPAAAEAATRMAADLESLRARKVAADRSREGMAGVRAHAEKLRADAAEAARSAEDRPSENDLVEQQGVVAAAAMDVDRLEVELAAARSTLVSVRAAQESMSARARAATSEGIRARDLVAQAEKVEKSLEEAIDVVTDEQIAQAEAASSAAQAALQAAKKRAAADAANAAAATAEDLAKQTKAEADRLDAVVRALSTEAPAAILAETENVATGLELDGDDVRLNGVSLDRLCGAEQMKFAADIAKAMNPNVGFLVVDGMERLDPDQLDAFVAAATAGGRQLFGSLVDRGDLVLAAVEHDDGTAVAAE